MVDEVDLEAELFDDLYIDDTRSSSVGARQSADVAAESYLGTRGGKAGAGRAARPQLVSPSASPPSSSSPGRRRQRAARQRDDKRRQSYDRLQELRRQSDAVVGQALRQDRFDIAVRTDQSLADLFAEAVARKRTTGEAMPGVSDEAAFEACRVPVLEQTIHDKFRSGYSPRRVSIGDISSGEIDAILRAKLEGIPVDRIETLLYVYDLQRDDPFDKLHIVRVEFNQWLDNVVDEVQIHSFLSLMLCGAEHSIVEKLAVVQQTCPGIPHLGLLRVDPTLRFPIGRAAACYARMLVMMHHFKLSEETRSIKAAIDDLNRVVHLLTRVILFYFPVLSQALLSEAPHQQHLNHQPGNRPLNEKASLVCRSAVEEAVAVPIFHGVVRPLYAQSDFAAQDRQLLDACSRAVAARDPQAVLDKLKVDERFRLKGVAKPFDRVVRILSLVWDPDSSAGAGATAKARLLVRASRTIPLCISQASSSTQEIGADDLLPVFIFCTIWSRPPNLASLMHFLDACVPQELLSSEAGYCLALLQRRGRAAGRSGSGKQRLRGQATRRLGGLRRGGEERREEREQRRQRNRGILTCLTWLLFVLQQSGGKRKKRQLAGGRKEETANGKKMMLKFAAGAAAVGAMMLSTAEAACPNACSGHGQCGEFDMCTCHVDWLGGDCSQRACPVNWAWVTTNAHGDVNADGTRNGVTIYDRDHYFENSGITAITTQNDPKGSWEQWPAFGNTASKDEGHFYMECSNQGICDRSTGECECFEGYTGAGCRRSVCPNDCSGHGVCQTVYQQRGSYAYTLWDKDMSRSCVCDAGYSGPDCSERKCGLGDDPLTTQQVHETQWVDIYSDRDGTNDFTLSGTFTLKFTDYFGKVWETDPITVEPYSSGASDMASKVAEALNALPNDVLSGVTVTQGFAEKVIPGTFDCATGAPGFAAGSTNGATYDTTNKLVRCPESDADLVCMDDGTNCVDHTDTNINWSGQTSKVCYEVAHQWSVRFAIKFPNNPGNIPDLAVDVTNVKTGGFTNEQRGVAKAFGTVTSSRELAVNAAGGVTVAYAYPSTVTTDCAAATPCSITGSTKTLTIDDTSSYYANARIKITCNGQLKGVFTVNAVASGTAMTVKEEIADCDAATANLQLELQSSVFVVNARLDALLSSGDIVTVTGFSGTSPVISSVEYDATNMETRLFMSTTHVGSLGSKSETTTTVGAGVISQQGDATSEAEECSGRGLCDRESGICRCFKGYTGWSCSLQNALSFNDS
ncbi:Tenascin (TN) (Hexabrachion) (Tenascin-C) (TN-C) [Durusdinium trenchii]|uniref:Tenascin (TN) (Hexabrachion) (Tenascin-C) (TN-C) n=1 Tax=Durusdinium trenchii TaxID=1381693 RepID=A0ABP0IMI6_9DINO